MYVFLFVFITLVFLIDKKSSDRVKRILFWIVFAVIFFISTFRSEQMGTDYHSYISIFRSVQNGWVYNKEVGYHYINKLAAFFGSEPYWLSGVINVIIFSGVISYIIKFVDIKYRMLCILIFCFNPYMYIQGTFNTLRGSIAIVFLLFFIKYLFNNNLKNNILFIISVYGATLFHKSAIIMLMLLLVVNIKWGQKKFLFLWMSIVILNLFSTNKFIKFMFNYVGKSRYSHYEASVFNTPIYFCFISVVIVFFVVNYRKLYENDYQKKCIDIYLFSLCFLLFAVKNDMVYRIYIYLIYISIPGLVFVIDNMKKKLKYGNTLEMIYVIYYMSFYIGYFSRLYILKHPHYFPFKFIFS